MCRGERGRVPCTESARSPERETVRKAVQGTAYTVRLGTRNKSERKLGTSRLCTLSADRAAGPAPQLRQLWGTVWARGARRARRARARGAGAGRRAHTALSGRAAPAGAARGARGRARGLTVLERTCVRLTSKGSVKLALIDINKLLSHLLTSNSPPIRISATTPVLAAAKALGLPAIPFRAPRQAYAVRVFLLSLGGSRRIPI